MTLDELKERWTQQLSHRGRCLQCDSERVWYNGIRLRKATLREGEQSVFVADIPVRRLLCGDCSARWSQAPTGVPWRAHYQPCVVSEAVVTDVLDGNVCDATVAKEHGCHRRTLLRWVERVARLWEPAELMRRVLLESETPVLPAAPPAVRPRRSAALRALGQRALWVLFLLEVLTSLVGLSPPGLSHASDFMPAHVSPSEAAGEADLRGERRPQKT
jgi:transposase-like protein